MRKLILFLIIALVTVPLIGAGNDIDFHPAPDPAYPIQRECTPWCWEVYTDAVTGNVRYRGYDSDSIFEGAIIFDQLADTVQQASYAEHLLNEETNAAAAALAGDIDGAKWVEKLREWSTAADGYYNQWPTLSDAQKDSVIREMARRQGLTWARLADLLTVLDKGR